MNRYTVLESQNHFSISTDSLYARSARSTSGGCQRSHQVGQLTTSAIARDIELGEIVTYSY